jgi:hypothetical protein
LEAYFPSKEIPASNVGLSLSVDSDNLVGRVSPGRADALRHTQRGIIGFSWRGQLSARTTVLLDNRLDEDPTYLGKRQSGYASYAEESYVVLTVPNFELLLGRAFCSWGPASSGSLILSDVQRPMDRVSVRFHYRWLYYCHVSAFLDRVGENNRYFSGHRFDIRLRPTVWLGLSETVVYGGPLLSPRFAFHIPVIPLFDPTVNESLGIGGDANIMGAVDVSVYPASGLQLYGQLLIDDIQVERQLPGDLEPAEWGFLVGLRGLPAGVFSEIEYARVTNRTYKTLHGFTNYVHRNRPLGFPYGSDCDRLWLRANHWLRDAFRAQTHVLFLRRGEGSMDKPFDQPWNIPGLAHYSEPFPTGIVESTWRAQLELRWHPVTRFGFAEAVLGYEAVRNVGNRAGENSRGLYYWFRLWLELGHSWSL